MIVGVGWGLVGLMQMARWVRVGIGDGSLQRGVLGHEGLVRLRGRGQPVNRVLTKVRWARVVLIGCRRLGVRNRVCTLRWTCWKRHVNLVIIRRLLRWSGSIYTRAFLRIVLLGWSRLRDLVCGVVVLDAHVVRMFAVVGDERVLG